MGACSVIIGLVELGVIASITFASALILKRRKAKK